MTLEIIYHDEFYVAINKPSGLLVHKSPIDKYETRFAIQLLRDQLQMRVYPVHRLDKPTSGVLLFALSKEALVAAQQLFIVSDDAPKKLQKDYVAIVRGFAPKQLQIDHPVKAQVDKRNLDSRNHQRGITHVQCLRSCEINAAIDKYPQSRYSLVKLQPLTGRRHQLRYHMKHIAHPIIGDAKYGKGSHNRYFQQHFNCQRLLLAAIGLQFQHPFNDKNIHIHASAGADFMATSEQLGLTQNTNDFMQVTR